LEPSLAALAKEGSALAVWWERYYPLIGAIIAGMCAYFVPTVKSLLTDLSPTVLSAGISMASIFIGFMATMAGVILATSSKAVAFMKKVGKLEQLVAFIWSSIVASFAFLITCMILLVTADQGLALVVDNQGWIWLASGTWSILATGRATYNTMILVR